MTRAAKFKEHDVVLVEGAIVGRSRGAVLVEFVAAENPSDMTFWVDPKNMRLSCDVLHLERALRVAAGMVSTTPGFANKQPQEVLDWIMEASK